MFVIVMEAVSGEFRVALPWGLLCADGLAVVAEAGEELTEKLDGWRDGMESGGMRVSVNKAMVVMGGERRREGQRAVGWPFGVCGEGIGGDSLQCNSCRGWVHGKCGGIGGSVSGVAKSFICGGCLGPVAGAGRTGVDVGASAKLELVDEFCCLGDMLSVDGDAGAVVEPRVHVGWSEFRRLVPLLTSGDVSLIVRGRLCGGCVRGGMLRGGETWPVGKEDVVALRRAGMRMVGWMCGVELKGRLPGEELGGLGMDDMALVCGTAGCIGVGMCCGGDDGDWVRRCVECEVQGPGLGGREGPGGRLSGRIVGHVKWAGRMPWIVVNGGS